MIAASSALSGLTCAVAVEEATQRTKSDRETSRRLITIEYASLAKESIDLPQEPDKLLTEPLLLKN